MLLVGYFEGLGSERAIAWRVADSTCVQAFLEYYPEEGPPDHSTLSRTRRLIDEEANDRHRRDDVGGERDDAEHRAPGHGRKLCGVREAFGGGLGGSEADAGGLGAIRPETQAEEDEQQ